MTINRKTISGLSVDTWGEKILLEDDVLGTTVTLSDEEADELIKKLQQAQLKVRQNKRRKS